MDITKLLVAEAEGIYARQQELIAILGSSGAILEGNGSRTQLGERVLSRLEDALTDFRRTLAQLQSMHPPIQSDARLTGLDWHFTDAANGVKGNAPVKGARISAGHPVRRDGRSRRTRGQ
ncbi:MAG TPA: hypothetical protein VN175_01455 [Rhizomicrobium sp.]|nr:hypothetical protein [Rhizomicrobium sp.]